MMRRLYDLADVAGTYLPHRWRKWLSGNLNTLSVLIGPPPCDDARCCVQAAGFTLNGFQPCDPRR